jgi:hypothetical protein
VCFLVAAGAFAARRPLLDAIFADTTSNATTAIQEAVPAATVTPAPVPQGIAGTPTSSEAYVAEAKTPPVASATPKPRSKKHKGNSQTAPSQEIDVGF